MANIFSSTEDVVEAFYAKRVALFKKLLGARVIDVLLHFPSYNVEKIYVEQVSSEHVNKIISTKMQIDYIDVPSKFSKQPVKICGKSGENMLEILLFNQKAKYSASSHSVGSFVVVTGKLSKVLPNIFQITHPEKISKILAPKISGFFNVYPLTKGIDNRAVWSVVQNACKMLIRSFHEEWLDADILKKNQWKSFAQSIYEVHHPTECLPELSTSKALQRVCFDELLAEQIRLKLSLGEKKIGIVIQNKKLLVQALLESLPFELTESQSNATQEIFCDLASGEMMARLLHGDVGSGKTIVAIEAALNVIESGYQVALLVPTEILARQHFHIVSAYFEKLGLKAEILTSYEKGKTRLNILHKVKSGEVNILIGTHAITTNQVEFDKLGLVIVDEQHKFGVSQRLHLIEKGKSVHVLSMTATPIPRTVILSTCGNVAVSSLKEKPIGRKPIETRAMKKSRIPELLVSLQNIINNNDKIYWVCPLIEETKTDDFICVVERAKYLQQHFGDDVQMLHGKMKAAEKAEIFQKFANGECKILVSTTVVEVGLDIPDAVVMIVENAERFGLAQLHQLRGRVGRGEKQSFCILLHEENLSVIARQRIDTMKKSNDGFFIAEQDLLMRGGGELVGTKQSGMRKYKTFDFFDPKPQAQATIHSLLAQSVAVAHDVVLNDNVKQYDTMLKIFAPFENFAKSF